jgi:prevent-host-death family protein
VKRPLADPAEPVARLSSITIGESASMARYLREFDHLRAGAAYDEAKVPGLDRLLHNCYDRRMSEVASRELRNDTAGVLRRVQAGEEVMVTVNGKPVAQLVPLQQTRRRWLPRSELARRLRVAQADPGLRDDLASLAGDTTEALGPIR